MTRFVAIVAVAVSLLFTANFAFAQPEEGAFYRIKNVNSKKVLALDDEEKDGAQILQRMTGEGERQQWSFVKVGKFYKIINRKSGQALNVQSKDEATPIIASDNGKNVQWSLEEKDGTYVIKSRHSGLVIDVAEESKDRKAPVIQYPTNDQHNQIFELVPVKD